MYTLLIFLCTASVLFFVRFIQDRGKRPVIWWVLFTGLAIYTHYYSAFILFFQMMYLLLFPSLYRSRGRRLFLALVATIVVVTPIFLLFFASGRFNAVYAEGAGGNPLRSFSLPYTFSAFSLGFSYGPSIEQLHRSASWASVFPHWEQVLPAALLFAGLLLVGLWSLRHRRERLVFLLLYLTVPILGACMAVFAMPQISYNVRYVSPALPAYLLLLTRGLLVWRRRVVRVLLLAAVLLFSTISIGNHYLDDTYAKENYRQIAEMIEIAAQRGDVIMATHLKPLKYYYGGDLEIHNLFWSPTFYRDMMGKRLRGFRRAWIIIGRGWKSDPEGKMRDYMKHNYAVVAETTITDLYLGLFDLTEPREGKRTVGHEGGAR